LFVDTEVRLKISTGVCPVTGEGDIHVGLVIEKKKRTPIGDNRELKYGNEVASGEV
jgi:hypothetical protein